MMGTEAFRSVFGAVPAGDEESTVRIVLGAVRAGFAVVLVAPGLKRPMCTLSAQQSKKADTDAQESARAEGRPRPGRQRHACGIAHALYLTGDPESKAREEGAVTRTVKRVLKSTGGSVNIGVELGRSRMVVVDVDTAQENAAFLADWIEAEGPDASRMQFTVQSPGALNAAGVSVHQDGGHYWFTVPDGVDLPAPADGVFKAPSGWTAIWNNRQVLVPPSVRPEGAYRMVGAAQPAPEWLLDLIRVHAKDKLDRKVKQANVLFDIDDPIDRWSAETPWSDLLTDPDHEQWTDTGLIDNCSCPIWTAPGGHNSPKSATAHELGCAIWDSSTGWAPLRIWTDNPPGFLSGRGAGKNITKLRYVALRDHDGADKSAMRALGLTGKEGADLSELFDGDFGYGPEAAPGGAVLAAGADTPALSLVPPLPVEELAVDPFADPDEVGADGQLLEGDDEDGPLTVQAAPESPAAAPSIWDRVMSSADLDDIPDLQPLVEGMLDLDTLTRVVGKSNHGKTFVTLDLACSVATGQDWHGHAVTQGLVIYVVAEGGRGIKKRIRAWERVHHGGEPIPADGIQLFTFPIYANDQANDVWKDFGRGLVARKPALIIFDTQARTTVGINENDNTEMGVFVEKVEKLRRLTGACVVLVHHLGHNGEQGRGASSVTAAVSTEIRVNKDKGNEITLLNDKQKDEAAFDPIVFTLEKDGDSAVLVAPGPADPFDGPSVTVESVPSQRLLMHLHHTAPDIGLTKAELRTVCATKDRDRHGMPMSKTAFYRAFNDAWKKGNIAQIDGSARFIVTDLGKAVLGVS